MTLTQLYLFTVVLPNASCFLAAIFFTLIVWLLICGIIALNKWFDCDEDEIPKLYKPVKYTIIAMMLVGFASIAFPSDKQLYMLAGGYVATNTKNVAKLPDNVVKAANAWLEKAAALADDKPKEKK